MSLSKDVQYPQLVHEDVWSQLKGFTDARIALGRVGCSVPTSALLAFQLAHAQAKDAVLQPLDTALLNAQLASMKLPILSIESCAVDKPNYLKRPDLGRTLSESSRVKLQAFQVAHPAQYDVVIVIGDGLSARAIEENAAAMVTQLMHEFHQLNWSVAALVIAQGCRVALGDEVAQLLNAQMLIMLIGERPGLSSPDSMGVYYTYAPQQHSHDAMRNCISNVRIAGLSTTVATQRLLALMQKSRIIQCSGVKLKDEHELCITDDSAQPKRLF